MNRPSIAAVAALCVVLGCPVVPAEVAAAAQTAPGAGAMAPMKHEAATPSTTLTVTGLEGSRTLSIAELKAMPHTTVTVTNSHTKTQESYSGVAVRDLLALVAPARLVPVNGAPADSPARPKASPRMTVIIARGTDGFRVALTLCDTDPGCRSGQSIVADSIDGQPLTTDGAFKLILTEDKIPGRWVRNLDNLTVKNLAAM